MHWHVVIPGTSLSKQANLVIGIDASMAHPLSIEKILPWNFIGDWLALFPFIHTCKDFCLKCWCDSLVGIDNENPLRRHLFHSKVFLGTEARPRPHKHPRSLGTGEVGYLIAGIKDVQEFAAVRAKLTEAGATRLFCSRTVLNYPGHLLGTARMGTDPERSVVNEWGRCHDVKNLFIVDGSIWVTGGGVNPTSTIQALALYVADTMKKNLANLFDD